MNDPLVNMQFDVFTLVCLLVIFLGLQMQITKLTKKIDQLLKDTKK